MQGPGKRLFVKNKIAMVQRSPLSPFDGSEGADKPPLPSVALGILAI